MAVSVNEEIEELKRRIALLGKSEVCLKQISVHVYRCLSVPPTWSIKFQYNISVVCVWFQYFTKSSIYCVFQTMHISSIFIIFINIEG